MEGYSVLVIMYFVNQRIKTTMQCVYSDPTLSYAEHRVPLPGQIHAGVSEVGRRIEVLSAGCQNQVNTCFITDPELGFPFTGYTSWWVY